MLVVTVLVISETQCTLSFVGVGLGVLVLGCILIPVFDLVVYDTVVEVGSEFKFFDKKI